VQVIYPNILFSTQNSQAKFDSEFVLWLSYLLLEPFLPVTLSTAALPLLLSQTSAYKITN
jgi:hypothetical protein